MTLLSKKVLVDEVKTKRTSEWGMVNRDQQSTNGTDKGPFSPHQITQWACRKQYQKSAQSHQVPHIHRFLVGIQGSNIQVPSLYREVFIGTGPGHRLQNHVTRGVLPPDSQEQDCS